MNVLQIISSEGCYGAENMMVGLAKHLSRLGCDVAVGVFDDSRRRHTEVGESAIKDGLNVGLLPCRGRWDWKTVRRIRREVDSRQVDLVHSHGYKADLYSYLATRGERSPVLISTCHSWPPGARVLRLYAAIDRLALRGFDQVATMSGEVEATLRRSGISPDKINLIFNGVDTAKFWGQTPTVRSEIPNLRKCVVGMVARIVPYKGAPILLLAARKVLSVDSDVSFVFVGEGESRRDFERMAGELGVAQNVFFAGARKDMPGVYASFDILALPSSQEAMPMALLEGMSAGKPAIATPVGSVPDLVVPYRTGYLVPVGNADLLADRILQLTQNPELLRRLGEGAREHICAHFSEAESANRYLELYNRATRNRAARGIARATVPL